MKQREVKPDSNTYSMILKAIIAFKDVPVGTVVGDLCTMVPPLPSLLPFFFCFFVVLFMMVTNNRLVVLQSSTRRYEACEKKGSCLTWYRIRSSSLKLLKMGINITKTRKRKRKEEKGKRRYSLSSFSDIKSCQDLIEEMTQHGVQMDVKFYTTIIDKLAKRGYWKEAKMIFSEIQTAGVALDAMVYDVMLTNTAKNGSYLDCVRYTLFFLFFSLLLFSFLSFPFLFHFAYSYISLFGKMREKNLYSAHSFTTMVNAAAANKRWSECYTFLDAMRAHHFVPDARAYTSLMSHVLACGNLREYQSLFASVRDTNVGDQVSSSPSHTSSSRLPSSSLPSPQLICARRLCTTQCTMDSMHFWHKRTNSNIYISKYWTSYKFYKMR